MEQDFSRRSIPSSPRLEMTTNVDVRCQHSACQATDAQNLCVSRSGCRCFPGGPASSEGSQAETNATVRRVASKIVELFYSKNIGNSGKNIVLYCVLEFVMAVLRISAENNERRASRLAPWQECAAKKLMTRDLACPPGLSVMNAVNGWR